MSITIVGLGPGDGRLLTREAQDILDRASEIYVRTREHPAVSALPSERVHSFDELYAQNDSFDEVYAGIARRVVELGCRPGDVIYAVPGHPRVGERTTSLIEALAAEQGVEVRIVDGLSFLEPLFNALRVDPLGPQGMQVVDAMIVAQRHYPPLDPTVPAVIAQCYNRVIASDVKLVLLNAYPEDHPVSVISSAGMDEAQVREVPLFELDRDGQFDYRTTLYVPPVAPGGSVTELQEVMAHLRSPDGCPWDRKQDHRSLRGNLLEETYEVLDALDNEDLDALREELGDLLMQIVFHVQIATEESEFRMADVTRAIVTKLRRRHPHVFGNVTVRGVDDVLRNWEAIKEEERKGKKARGDGGPLSGVSKGLPALAQAQDYLDRAERIGIKRPADLEMACTLLAEEGAALDLEDRLGQALLTLVNWARAHGVDAESALRRANERLREEVNRIHDAGSGEDQP
ncbi:MAG: MazG family protein [Anaerolineae bacterium]|nr:MazG family protein [Anaerolineae bacterium]